MNTYDPARGMDGGGWAVRGGRWKFQNGLPKLLLPVRIRREADLAATADGKAADLGKMIAGPEAPEAPPSWAEIIDAGELTGAERNVLALTYREGLGGPAVGRRLGLSRDRVRGLRTRALEKLRRALARRPDFAEWNGRRTA